MSDLLQILNTPDFQSKDTLKQQMHKLGLAAGDQLIVHSSLKSIGWVAGGAQAVVEALMEIITPEGTLVMPSQSADNSDPSYWMAPPIPENWHQPTRDHMPAYDPALTNMRGMGKIPECLHRHPATIRSPHPSHSFIAWGRFAAEWMAEHPLEDSFGKTSPLGKMMEHPVKILLIGTGFDSCTALHYAEFVQPAPSRSPQGAAMYVNGVRQWATYHCIDMDSDRFPEIIKDFPGTVTTGTLGQAETQLTDMRPLVEFAVTWLQQNPPTQEPNN